MVTTQFFITAIHVVYSCLLLCFFFLIFHYITLVFLCQAVRHTRRSPQQYASSEGSNHPPPTTSALCSEMTVFFTKFRHVTFLCAVCFVCVQIKEFSAPNNFFNTWYMYVSACGRGKGRGGLSFVS